MHQVEEGGSNHINSIYPCPSDWISEIIRPLKPKGYWATFAAQVSFSQMPRPRTNK